MVFYMLCENLWHKNWFFFLLIQDGVTLTIASFSQLANGFPDVDQPDLTKPSKAEKLLGNGSGGMSNLVEGFLNLQVFLHK